MEFQRGNSAMVQKKKKLKNEACTPHWISLCSQQLIQDAYKIYTSWMVAE